MVQPLQIGDRLEVVLPGLDGRPIALEAFRGKHVLLFMWASW